LSINEFEPCTIQEVLKKREGTKKRGLLRKKGSKIRQRINAVAIS